MTPLRQRMLNDMEMRNLAENTQKSYLIQVRRADSTGRRNTFDRGGVAWCEVQSRCIA
jgi:hypothetical protein